MGGGLLSETGLAMAGGRPGDAEGLRCYLLWRARRPRASAGIRVTSQGLMHKIRKAFSLYVNLRPARLFPGVVSPIRDKEGIDLASCGRTARGSTRGSEAGSTRAPRYGDGDSGEVVTRQGAERIMRFAFELARSGAERSA